MKTPKKLKYIIISTVLALGFALPAINAQDAAPKARQNQRGENRGGRDMTGPLLKDITLTAEQQAKVNEINADAEKQRQALAQEERRGKGMEIMQNRNAKIREVLTPEQQKTFDANLKEMQARMGERNKGGKGDKGGRPGQGKKQPKADNAK